MATERITQNEEAEHRLVVFGDSTSRICRSLIPALLAAVRQRPSLQFVAFVESAPHHPPAWMRKAVRFVRTRLDTQQVLVHRDAEPPEVADSLRPWNVRWIVPPERNINHPQMRQLLQDDLRPTLTLSLGCGQIFSPDLLRACSRPVNFHNALLPSYGGVRATSWAVYQGATITGFTYHYMTEAVDAGPILLQEPVAITPGAGVSEIDHAILDRAARRMNEVLDLVARGDPGRPQTGTPSYFGLAALREIRRIDDVSAHRYDELQRRLTAFKWLNVRLGGRVWEVTDLDRRPEGDGRPGLTTADGVPVRARRFMCMPAALYRVYRMFRRRTRD